LEAKANSQQANCLAAVVFDLCFAVPHGDHRITERDEILLLHRQQFLPNLLERDNPPKLIGCKDIFAQTVTSGYAKTARSPDPRSGSRLGENVPRRRMGRLFYFNCPPERSCQPRAKDCSRAQARGNFASDVDQIEPSSAG